MSDTRKQVSKQLGPRAPQWDSLQAQKLCANRHSQQQRMCPCIQSMKGEFAGGIPQEAAHGIPKSQGLIPCSSSHPTETPQARWLKAPLHHI